MAFEISASFQSGVYKLVSAVDSNCIDCEGGGGKKKTKLILWHFNGGDNQRFHLHPESQGFRIGSLVKDKKEGTLLVVEANDRKTQLSEFTANPNQLWEIVQTESPEGAVLIRNTQSGLCLRNMGHSDPVGMFEEATDDKSQWWILTKLD